ncbi:MAG: hypothetical protein SGPRY_008819 [Prymnesium sp.]
MASTSPNKSPQGRAKKSSCVSVPAELNAPWPHTSKRPRDPSVPEIAQKAQLTRLLEVSADSSGWAYQPPTTAASSNIGISPAFFEDADLDLLFSVVQSHPLFYPIDDEQKKKVCASVRGIRTEQGQVIIRQGEMGDCLYIVSSGTYKVSFDDAALRCSVHPSSYSSGQIFGELALLYNNPRGATITCTKAGLLFMLGQAAFRQIFANCSSESKVAFLNQTALFGRLAPTQVSAISSVMEEQTFDEGAPIVREGEPADALYVVRSGGATVMQQQGGRNVEVGTLGEGECFGESSLAEDATRIATVVARGQTTVLRLGRERFRLLCDTPLPALLDRCITRNVLAMVDLFDGMGTSEFDSLLAAFELAEYVAGESIVRQGEDGESFFVIRSGTVSISRTTEDGEEVVVKEGVGVGEYFGEASMLRQEPRHATVRASSSVVCLTLHHSHFSRSLGPRLDYLKREAAKRAWAAENIKDRRITLQDLRVVAMLGVGTFGRVQMVVHKATNTTYAMKCLSKGQVRR